MTRTVLPANRNFDFVLLIVLMIVVGCLRIGLTYSVFWQTIDEPFHIAAGMEWLDKGQYTYELFHPPLARVMGALGLYLNGIRGVDNMDSPWSEGNAILQSLGMYERNLTLARIGILPFFIIASLVVALWSKNCARTATSLLATLLFTTLPPILAHSGLATLDMACTALVAAALFSLTLWLNKPTLLHSLSLGITVGLAILSKFSSIGFLLVAGGLTVAIYSLDSLRSRTTGDALPTIIERNSKLNFPTFRRRFFASVIALLLCFLTIWAGYRFSLTPLTRFENTPHTRVDHSVETGLCYDITHFILEAIPIPPTEFRKGINDFCIRNKYGHLAYLMGDIKRQGWWYFFPILILLKTPLPFLILSAIGFFFISKNFFANLGWLQLSVPAVATMGILAVGMSAHVDNGLRQLLSVYPLLAIVAGYGALKLMSLNTRFKLVGWGLITILFSWQLISSFAAHPDYLPYFNELVRNHPEEIVVDSDLDWGQDLKRLALTLKNRRINELTIKYSGSTNLDLLNLSTRHELKPYQRETGWIAINIFCLKLGTAEAPYDQYSWLRKYQPVERVGKSIWLYYIPKD